MGAEVQPSKLYQGINPYSKRHLAYAAVAQLAERHLAMVEVAGSSPVCRSILKDTTSNADDSISSTVMVKGTPGTDIRTQGAHGFGPCIRQAKFLPSETQWYLAGIRYCQQPTVNR